MTHRVPYNPHLHTAAMFRVLTEAAFSDLPRDGFCKVELTPHDLGPPAFRASGGLLNEVRAIVRRTTGGQAGSPVVLLNPNASDLMPLRRWPPERFVELARRIVDRYPDGMVLITGAPSEGDAGKAIAAEVGHPRVFSVAGQTTLAQLLTLYCIADVLVTNDSGPGHFAAMTPVHSIVLFGPETPLLYGPLGSNTHVLSADLSCSPCVNVLNHRFSPCRDNVCMKAITVEQVFRVVESVLPGHAASSRGSGSADVTVRRHADSVLAGNDLA